MASFGERTCDVCGGLDGRRFKLSEKQPGVNFPPLHPNCRCTTVAVDPDDDLEDVKSGELDYEQWYQKYVGGRAPEKLEYREGAETAVPRGQPVPVMPGGARNSAGQLLTTRGESGIIKARQPIRISLQYFAEIPKEKFTKYALDPLKQPDKARAFREALGYTMDNYQELIDNISANLDESALKLKGSNDHGQLYEYVMRITGANGKQANVCTGWIIENAKTEPRLTSAYVTEKKVTKKDDD